MPTKVKTRQEIAMEYSISRRTLYRWLKREKIILKGSLVTIKQQEIIYKTFGLPTIISKEEIEFFTKKIATYP